MERVQTAVMEIVPHAVQRMSQRKYSLKRVMLFLTRCDKVAVFGNNQGCEILIPSRGRLVGSFSNGTFTCKSFLRTPYKGRDYYPKAMCLFKIRILSVAILRPSVAVASGVNIRGRSI
jgi:hypothetical protein